MKDSDFVNQFSVVLGVLVVFVVLVFILANALSEDYVMSAQHARLVEERIKPIGKVHVGEVVMEAAPEEAAELTPERAYQQACAACHASGLLNSPAYGDEAAWASRKGDLEALYQSAIKGKGLMPPKGGSSNLSDDMVRQIVDYMLDAV